jgi:hypothetical protein
MREIGSEEKIEKRNKRNAVIISIVMLGILVISTAGYAFITGTENRDDKDSEPDSGVQQRGEYWVFEFEGKVLQVSSSLEQVENTSVSISPQITLDKYRQKPLYIASNNTGISYELGSTIGRFAQRAQAACYSNCTDNLPVKNCYDNLIVWRESEENRVYQNDSCVFIEGDLRTVDAFIYRIFGIN